MLADVSSNPIYLLTANPVTLILSRSSSSNIRSKKVSQDKKDLLRLKKRSRSFCNTSFRAEAKYVSQAKTS